VRQVLLVDDDIDLCALMADFFAQHEFAIDAAHDGPRGLARALEGSYDLIILDVMLPVLDGFELLKQIRRRSSVPVIMLTARTGQQDRIAGLDAGADDYLPKPFGPEELLARMRAVLRRATQTAIQAQTAEAGDLRVNSQTREVSLAGEAIELTSIEFDILDFLVRSAGRVVSRNELAAVLYQRESTPYERTLDVHISHLRKKLEPSERVQIRTVRGVGYLFWASAEKAE
jgi:two-component system response regulator CpxR